jgi:hypothetical protein
LYNQKLNYLHSNPVTAGIVSEYWHWKYSSAIDYLTNDKDLLDLVLLEYMMMAVLVTQAQQVGKSAPMVIQTKFLILKFIMKSIVLFSIFFCTSFGILAQKPKNGIYTYSIAFTEWNGRSLGATCTVIIKGDSIKVIHNGKANLNGKQGDIIDQGVIMKHTKTGKWIIGHMVKDKDAQEIGGCFDGASIIDFKRKKIWIC